MATTLRRAAAVWVLLVSACGGLTDRRDPAEDADAASKEATAGPVVVADTGSNDASECDHPQSDYVHAPPTGCTGVSFTCLPGTAAFMDSCGCGCTTPRFPESGGAANLEPRAVEGMGCGGPIGEFALFETSISQMVIGEDELVVRAGPRAWSVDKRTRQLTPRALSSSQPEPVNGSVVSTGEPRMQFEANGYFYANQDEALVRFRIPGGAAEPLFDIPEAGDGSLAFVVIGEHFYSTSSEGTLWHALVAPEPTEPTVIERRGRYDDDDYGGMGVLGADTDAVYWQAGLEAVRRTSDGDPLALFRTCRE